MSPYDAIFRCHASHAAVSASPHLISSTPYGPVDLHVIMCSLIKPFSLQTSVWLHDSITTKAIMDKLSPLSQIVSFHFQQSNNSSAINTHCKAPQSTCTTYRHVCVYYFKLFSRLSVRSSPMSTTETICFFDSNHHSF